ncbi:hypothetical protein NMY22_g16358 [Coprinellus aureogranulatus]|nr:hypothetical protein NMY22_g16358 [Coprinellus aureogranulatus]
MDPVCPRPFPARREVSNDRLRRFGKPIPASYVVEASMRALTSSERGLRGFGVRGGTLSSFPHPPNHTRRPSAPVLVLVLSLYAHEERGARMWTKQERRSRDRGSEWGTFAFPVVESAKVHFASSLRS